MPPAHLAALFDLAPWERQLGYNGRPVHQWFLDPLAEAFPDVTFHGLVHTQVSQFAVEGFQLIAPADRVLELLAWLRDQRVPATWLDADSVLKPGDSVPLRPDDWGLHQEDDGRWHYWAWWD
jgi:hypothetical protein